MRVVVAVVGGKGVRGAREEGEVLVPQWWLEGLIALFVVYVHGEGGVGRAEGRGD